MKQCDTLYIRTTAIKNTSSSYIYNNCKYIPLFYNNVVFKKQTPKPIREYKIMTKSTPIDANIAVLSGDGIGPEVMDQAILCLDKVYFLFFIVIHSQAHYALCLVHVASKHYA